VDDRYLRQTDIHSSDFYRANSYASVVLGIIIILSGCLSVTRVLCNKTKQCTADILIRHKRAVTLVF